ncbi:uncharacterized protein LOC133745060 [Rosa rugosa]|uniref:uncharacterized protein LOC133745060 n=1 Tax=Rosa rugosa TaxID=74645 RepID=UPI002B40269E|nr:uncharacterized protein LOC133745060 [Rosa rugosa]
MVFGHDLQIRYAYELLTNPSWKRNYDIFGFEEQIDVIEKLKKKYAGESFSRIHLPLLESAASDSEDHNLPVITSKDFQTMFQDNKPWLIQAFLLLLLFPRDVKVPSALLGMKKTPLLIQLQIGLQQPYSVYLVFFTTQRSRW